MLNTNSRKVDQNPVSDLADLLQVDSCLTKERLIEFLKPLARGLVKMFGQQCEVVIHDFDDPEHSIVWIEGNVTNRRIGGSVSEIGMRAIRGGDAQEDLIGYVHDTKNGRVLRSSTFMLRDPDGRVFGCFCINLDVTELAAVRGVIDRWLPGTNSATASVKFTDQIDEVLGRIIEAAVEAVPKAPALMSREDRLAFIAALDQRGAFAVQRAVPTISEYLGVSRTTIYTYLEEVRSARREHED